MKQRIQRHALLALCVSLSLITACGDTSEDSDLPNVNNAAPNNTAPNNTAPNNTAPNNTADSGVDPMEDVTVEPDAMGESDAQDMSDDAMVPGEDVGVEDMDAMVEADTPPDMEGPACPPEGPFGAEQGDVMPEVSLPDCDGQMHSVRELCSQDAAWLFVFAEWCPACRRSAESFEGVVDQFSGQDVGAFFIISENSSFAAPSAADCSAVRARYGITVPVLYDADGTFVQTLGIPANDMSFVMDGGNLITFKRQYAFSSVPGAIEEALSR